MKIFWEKIRKKKNYLKKEMSWQCNIMVGDMENYATIDKELLMRELTKNQKRRPESGTPFNIVIFRIQFSPEKVRGQYPARVRILVTGMAETLPSTDKKLKPTTSPSMLKSGLPFANEVSRILV